MKLYGFPLSPFVRKVLVALSEKGLEAELVPTNPQQPLTFYAIVWHKYWSCPQFFQDWNTNCSIAFNDKPPCPPNRPLS